MNQARDMGDDEKPDANERKKSLHYEFDCPDCNAHNPYDDGFREGSEIICCYCGMSYLVKKSEGRFRFSAL